MQPEQNVITGVVMVIVGVVWSVVLATRYCRNEVRASSGVGSATFALRATAPKRSESIIQIDAPASRQCLENEIVGVARIREEHRSGRPLCVVRCVREILGPDGRRPGLAFHPESQVQQGDRIALREVV